MPAAADRQTWSVALLAVALVCDLYAASGTGFRSGSFYRASWAVAPVMSVVGCAVGLLVAAGWVPRGVSALALALSLVALGHRPSRATEQGMPASLRRWRSGGRFVAPNAVTDPWRWRRVILMTGALLLQIGSLVAGR
ncbi:hypothetical protein EBM89_05830 [Cellulomonas triticagri]|uniref:Uncharacterized protein n=1 Tax=Cellulomonas triticagri TaxID=2483352 RepID=A0A3M2JLL6_9CELL|nr:hypothetical protein EBM89_05830 [Cellulomonas triticagri]